jgi:GrpB-like predicted nucleotidyltransferase (UPF0157 family)
MTPAAERPNDGDRARPATGRARSGPVVLVEPRAEWVELGRGLAAALSAAAPDRVVRVDHIGSTAVAGMRAKDRVDVQVLVRSLDPRDGLASAFEPLGLHLPLGFDDVVDHVPLGWHGDASHWQKLLFTGTWDGARCNVHVRVHGSANARYALLFRDYLRAVDVARDSWALFKGRLASIANDLDEYVEVKDSATDVLMLAAERWAAATGWGPPA